MEILPKGALIDGSYIVCDVLGVGTSSIVYKCFSPELEDIFFALKVLNLRTNAESEGRFKMEIAALYDVAHPNVVRPYSFFREKDLLGLMLEYVEGGDLRDMLERGKRFSPAGAAVLMERVADALVTIHENGVIHRDLKPENILMPALNVPKVTDFGVALLTGGPRFTRKGGVLGTAYYVSPEYLEFDILDHRSDIYALGIIGYELLMGRVPFDGETITQVLNAKLLRDLPSIQEFVEDVPNELGDILKKAVSRDPTRRYQSALELRNALFGSRCYSRPQ